MDKFMVGILSAVAGAGAVTLLLFFASVEEMKDRIVNDKIVYVGDAMYSCEEVDR
jgi:adenylate kinase